MRTLIWLQPTYINNEDPPAGTEKQYIDCYLCIAIIFCFVIEIISVIYSFSYASKYDEYDSDLARISAILLFIGFIGQTVGFLAVVSVAPTLVKCCDNYKDSHNPGETNLCFKYLLITILPFVGPLQLIHSCHAYCWWLVMW